MMDMEDSFIFITETKKQTVLEMLLILYKKDFDRIQEPLGNQKLLPTHKIKCFFNNRTFSQVKSHLQTNCKVNIIFQTDC